MTFISCLTCYFLSFRKAEEEKRLLEKLRKELEEERTQERQRELKRQLEEQRRKEEELRFTKHCFLSLKEFSRLGFRESPKSNEIPFYTQRNAWNVSSALSASVFHILLCKCS